MDKSEIKRKNEGKRTDKESREDQFSESSAVKATLKNQATKDQDRKEVEKALVGQY